MLFLRTRCCTKRCGGTEKAADQGHVNAQLNLGNMYEKGRGVAQSDMEAVRWYRTATDQGDADC